MLAPDNRHLLMEALRPPPGMRLDVAVGTSFTLNLQAVLLAPVSFAVYGASVGTVGADPVALLEAVRSHADRITIFAQAGAIAAPLAYQPTFAWLEDSVVPVRPPKGHLFHPKVWALRFTSADEANHEEDAEDATAHRLLVMSRNLTFDRSWDTVVVLDGVTSEADQPESEKAAEFIRSLAGTAVVDMSEERAVQVEDLANSVARVEWELPPGIDELRLWPMGRGAPKPDLTGGRSLVISPFITADGLAELAPSGSDHLLISRPESMDGIGADALTQFSETFVLDSDALPEDDTDGPGDNAGEDETPPSPEVSLLAHGVGREVEPIGAGLVGLHAKAYIVERGRRTHLVTGSTNATGPGLNGGIEFLVELVAKRSKLSIDSVLGVAAEDGKDREATLRDMLAPYRPTDPEPIESSELDKLSYKLESAVRRLAEVAFRIELTQQDDGSDYFRMRYCADHIPPIADGTIVTIRPSSLRAGASQPVEILEGPLDADGGTVSLVGMTSFLVLTATAKLEGERVSASTLVNAELIGAPSDRMSKLLSAQLTNKADVVRYLLFLLHDLGSDAEIEGVLAAAGVKGFFGGEGGSGDAQVPLFEAMLRCLVSGGSALTQVGKLLKDLKSTPESTEKIPDGLEDIYWPIREAYDGTTRPDSTAQPEATSR